MGFLHSLHLGYKLRARIHDEFPQRSYFSVKKEGEPAQISQPVDLSVAGQIITHSVETRTNTR
jgi:hypothetical protein